MEIPMARIIRFDSFSLLIKNDNIATITGYKYNNKAAKEAGMYLTDVKYKEDCAVYKTPPKKMRDKSCFFVIFQGFLFRNR